MNIPSFNPKALEKQLRKILTGIEKNINDWPESIQINKNILERVSDELEEKIKEINTQEIKIYGLRKDLNDFINQSAKPLYKRARDRAYSIHGKSSGKLEEYDFKKCN